MSQPNKKITPAKRGPKPGYDAANLIWVAAEVAEIKQWEKVVAKQTELAPLIVEHQRLNDIRVKAREAMTTFL